MDLKRSIAIIASLLLALACKEGNKQTVPETQALEEIDPLGGPKAYAEISIAQGGAWEGREYKGGTSFKNVERLKVPKSHTDHSWYIRYEGPGWESDKVGYRLYLDWRNAIDIFGKKTDSLVLDRIGHHGFDSYHEMQPWGTDILKVGNALGLGSYGRLVSDSVYHFQKVDSTIAEIQNADDRATVNLDYYGWQTANTTTDLAVSLSIEPDSRMTTAILQTSEAVEGLVTGIVKFEGVGLLKSPEIEGDWAYIATYGKQTLVPDSLGMALFYRKDQVKEILDGHFDHLIVFQPTTELITYQFAAAWEKEKEGIGSEKEFRDYLANKLSELNP